MAKSALEKQRILITGASGFIGHALASALSTLDCTIVRTSRDQNKLQPLDGAAAIVDRVVDYSDPEIWPGLIEGVDTIFWLGAQTSANNANKDPDQDYRDNVLPLRNLLERCRLSDCAPAIVFASTATVVGLTDSLPVAEDCYENPITIYDIHKLNCEKYLSYYAGNGHIKTCSLRLANIYGPGTESSNADRGILNLMIRRALAGDTLEIYGTGTNIRDYSYIDDVIDAFIAAATHIDACNTQQFNIGSGRGYSFVEAFDEIANCIGSRLGHDVNVEYVAAPDVIHAIEGRDYIADATRFSQITGWSPQVDLPSGILKTFEELQD